MRYRSKRAPLPYVAAHVATVLTPLERQRVDTAAHGVYTPLHRNSVDEAVADVRAARAGAVLISITRYPPQSTAHMARMIREFPRIPVYGLLSDLTRANVYNACTLARAGMRTLVDASSPTGWSMLRDLLAREQEHDVRRVALGALNDDLAGAPPDCWRFFEVLFAERPVVSVRDIGRRLQVVASTLMSRFVRAGLPSPKRYIVAARLVRVARLLENPGTSAATVALQLDFSSAQSFSRHVHTWAGMSPRQFRSSYDGAAMLNRLREELVLPYTERLRTFTLGIGLPM